LQQERETAAGVVTRLLSETPYSEWPKLAGREELRNSGALEKLGQESTSRLHRSPLEALAIADLETNIADALPAETYPRIVMAQLRATSWKDRGQALWYLARYEEALDALDHAERNLQQAAEFFVQLDLPVCLANVELSRGRMMVRRGQLENGIRILAATRDRLLRYGLVEEAGLCGLDIVEAFLIREMAVDAES